MHHKIPLSSIWFIGSLLLVIDRLIKYFFLGWGGSFGPANLQVSLTKNLNILFYLQLPTILGFLMVTIVWSIIILIVVLEKNKTQQFIISATLIIIGGFSNLIDRLLFGFVIDYLNILRTIAFNLADLYLIAGVINLLLFYKQKNVS